MGCPVHNKYELVTFYFPTDTPGLYNVSGISNPTVNVYDPTSLRISNQSVDGEYEDRAGVYYKRLYFDKEGKWLIRFNNNMQPPHDRNMDCYVWIDTDWIQST